MHSRQRLTEQRLDRVLNQRIRPAVHARCVPLRVDIEAVKLADDLSGDLVVRLYETHGGRARSVLTTGFPVGVHGGDRPAGT
jgi:hypothetical protein